MTTIDDQFVLFVHLLSELKQKRLFSEKCHPDWLKSAALYSKRTMRNVTLITDSFAQLKRRAYHDDATVVVVVVVVGGSCLSFSAAGGG